jgi:hypothetical protein
MKMIPRNPHGPFSQAGSNEREFDAGWDVTLVIIPLGFL